MPMKTNERMNEAGWDFYKGKKINAVRSYLERFCNSSLLSFLRLIFQRHFLNQCFQYFPRQ